VSTVNSKIFAKSGGSELLSSNEIISRFDRIAEDINNDITRGQDAVEGFEKAVRECFGDSDNKDFDIFDIISSISTDEKKRIAAWCILRMLPVEGANFLHESSWRQQLGS
jgi:hypothetical protein